MLLAYPSLLHVWNIASHPQPALAGTLPEKKAPPTNPIGPMPDADLALAHVHPLWLLFCFIATFLLYVLLIPHFLLYSSPPTGDQPFYLMDTVSIVQDGDLNVKNNYDNHDYDLFYKLAPHPPGFVGMSAPYPLGRQLAASIRPPSEEYSVHLPGLSLLLVPAWEIGGIFSLWWPGTILFMCIIGSLVCVNVFLFAYELTGKAWIACAVWLPVAFSSPIMTYSYLIFTELLTGLLLIYAFRRLAMSWGANGPWRLMLIGVCIGYIPWVASRAVLLAAALGLYAAVQWWRYFAAPGLQVSRTRLTSRPFNVPGKAGLLSALWLLVPVVLSAALMVYYNLFIYGALLPNPAKVFREGTPALNWPWGGLDNLQKFLRGAFGLFFDIQWGLLIYAPIYLLAVVGVVAMLRMRLASEQRLLLWMALLIVPYMAVVAAYPAWNGLWCPPARYLTTFVPLAAGPLAVSLLVCRDLVYKIIYALFALAGWGAMAIMMSNPILMWPFGDGRLFWGGVFDWLAHSPNAPIHPDLRHTLPSFITPDEIRQPANTGLILAVAFLTVFLCSLLVRRPGSQYPLLCGGLLGARCAAVAWVGVLSFLGLGWFVMNAPYLHPQTVLVEQRRWTLPQPLKEAHGIAYLDGELYIASLGPRSPAGVLQAGVGELGEFDIATGSYTTIHPVSASGPLPYGYPGDIKVGPDGLLYLLNNGPNAQALYIMKPGGQVVRQVALNGKSPLAIGLGIGPDGKLYATDMSRIHQFGPNGGNQLASWGIEASNFNNIGGVTVDPDNRVYGAETSEKRVHSFDSAGRLLRTVDLGCQPWQMVVTGDWLDISCEGGIRSLNRKSGEVQVARIGAADQPSGSLTGLAYGPDHTLYVFDNQTSTIVAYTVQH